MEKLNRHCGSGLGLGVMRAQRSKAKAKRKEQNFLISVTLTILIGCFSKRESNSILSGKGKGFTFEELFRSPFTKLTFQFYYKKEFTLKVLFQIHQTFKLI